MCDASEAAAADPSAPLLTLGDGRIEAERADPPEGVPVLCRDTSGACGVAALRSRDPLSRM
jgi:hypothetical protein